MRVGLLGRKVGMTQIYEADGTAVPVTVLECGPCTVLQVRTEERDGYHALQLGFADKKRKSATQAERGHARRSTPSRSGTSARSARTARSTTGRGPDPDGRGLQRDQDASTSSARARGGASRASSSGTASRGCGPRTASSGCTATPAPPAPAPTRPHTRKGIRKPGQYGNARITVRNLKVVRVDPTNNLLLVRGAVPGPNGGFLTVRQTNKV